MRRTSGRAMKATVRHTLALPGAARNSTGLEIAQTIDRPAQMSPRRSFRLSRSSGEDGVGNAPIIASPTCLVRPQHRAELDADEVDPDGRQHAAKLQIGRHRRDRTIEAVPGDTKVGTACFCIECENGLERLDELVTLWVLGRMGCGKAGGQTNQRLRHDQRVDRFVDTENAYLCAALRREFNDAHH
ncbi:MAG: hypothetical protein JWO15_1250 [Sphingomonadales bacterium]|nr:hypothetical protein [Sphingomonadales bacterium]